MVHVPILPTFYVTGPFRGTRRRGYAVQGRHHRHVNVCSGYAMDNDTPQDHAFMQVNSEHSPLGRMLRVYT